MSKINKKCNKEGHETDEYGCIDCFVEELSNHTMKLICEDWNETKT